MTTITDDLPEVTLEPMEALEVTDFMSAANLIYAIRKQQELIERIKQQKKEAMEYYDKKVINTLVSIDYMKGKIMGFLKVSGERSLSSHLGTASLVTRRLEQWPEDEALKAFAEVNRIANYQKVQYVLDKPTIKDWCHAHRVFPPQYSEGEAESLTIRHREQNGGGAHGDY